VGFLILLCILIGACTCMLPAVVVPLCVRIILLLLCTQRACLHAAGSDYPSLIGFLAAAVFPSWQLCLHAISSESSSLTEPLSVVVHNTLCCCAIHYVCLFIYICSCACMLSAVNPPL
jgi:hypothetical protein